MVDAVACVNEYELFTGERREGGGKGGRGERGKKIEKEGEREEGRERKSNYIEREKI